MKKQFRDFESAREFVRSLGLSGQRKWYEYCKSDKKPDDIPTSPEKVFKKKGWISWGDFLGNGRVHNQNFLSFTEAKKFVHDLKLKDQHEWFQYCKSGNKPDNIPSNPNLKYKKDGWKSYGDWIGNDNIASTKIEFLPFKEARKFVRSLGLKSTKEWKEYSKSGNRPNNIPGSPEKVYKEWKKK
jgi:hypothetical protein